MSETGQPDVPVPAAGTTSAPGLAGGNRLLGRLPESELIRLASGLERVALSPGRVLFEPGDDVTHAHFPLPGTVVSLLAVLADGRVTESAAIGCEGAVGVIISGGEKPAFARAVVQVAGAALRLEAAQLEQAKLDSAAVRDVISRYADSLLAQVLQSVACNALHGVESRIARWLLMLQDRCFAAELPLTQEFLADQLGVRRTTVTRAMAELEAAGAIRHSRGRVLVVSRPRLERACCECYRAVRDHFERVAPGLYPTAPP